MGFVYGTPPAGNVAGMNAIKNVNAVSINQVQSSLPIGTVRGPPPVGNVTQMDSMENVNAVSINQDQSSLPDGFVHGPPPVGNAVPDVNTMSINRAQCNPKYYPSCWHSGMPPGRNGLVLLPVNVFKCYGCG